MPRTDRAALSSRCVVISELLCDAAGLRPGWRVLDVAGGTGNTALAAARSGCRVVSQDEAGALQGVGRVRAATEGLSVEWAGGAAADLPFPDGSFDAVVSAAGVMFAPDQRAAAAQMLRVCRPGGVLALASWTPDSFMGALLRTTGARAGRAAPSLWGTEERVRELLGHGVDEMWLRTRAFRFRFASPRDFAEALAGDVRTGAGGMRDEIAALIVRHDPGAAAGGPVELPCDYLEVVARRSAA